ncbi:MAG: hypothetical protein J6C50_02910, partial [Rickettsiales bacterium]|nr:hypothetical protein [Rickettsiales bacterium]
SFGVINNANAENSDDGSTSCLILDKLTNEIKYNTKGKNCFILRNIDSTQQSKITDLGLNGATGEFCNLSINDDYVNAESVAGITMLNGTKKAIKCSDGYSGNITISCKDGNPIHSGDTKCTFNGCKKHDNNIINNSLNDILTTNNMVNWDNINEEDKTNLSSNDGITYSKNDIIATLSCKEKDGYNLRDGSNGYSIKCDGNDNIVVDNNGGCEYESSGGCIGLPGIDSKSYYGYGDDWADIGKRDNCDIITYDDSNYIMYNDENKESFYSGYYYYYDVKNYRFTNGTIVDMSCREGYTECDGCGSCDEFGHDDDLIDCFSNECPACWYNYYYECKNNKWVKRGGCKANTCLISDLTTDTLGNEFVKTITQCNDETCSIINTNEVIDITTEEGKNKTYDYNTYITINSCIDGHEVLKGKRVMRCNEYGGWDIYGGTDNNKCSAPCKLSDLNHSLLTNNSNYDSYVKTVVECNDENCLNIKQNTVIDITYFENMDKTYIHGTYITINSCDTGYIYASTNGINNNSNNRVLMCNGGQWDIVNNDLSNDLKSCRVKIDYYSPILYDDVNKDGNITASIYKEIGEQVTCNASTFNQEIDNNVLRVCGINNYRIAHDNENIIIKTIDSYTKHLFCHGSYIPRDLNVGWNGSIESGGLCNSSDDKQNITKQTYKISYTNINSTSNLIASFSDNFNVNSFACDNDATWVIKEGANSIEFEYTGSVVHFCIPRGSKESGLTYTFELWGAQGGTDYGGKGGYTKGVLISDNYNNGDKYYIVVGGAGDVVNATSTASAITNNSYNGGGFARSIDIGKAVYSGAGGGATHVALRSGELKNISKNNVLLVAGGGGGSVFETYDWYSKVNGGDGGGNNNNGLDGEYGHDEDYGIGGTGIEGGPGYCHNYKTSNDASGELTLLNQLAGGFGYGGNCIDGLKDDGSCSGGGAGYYGGGASIGGMVAGGGGGGSGYCDESKFTCSGENGVQSGNGKVVISW